MPVDGPTKSPEEARAARIEHYLEYRGCPAHFVIWLIYVWILGKAAQQSRNAVCALKINCKLFPFPLEKSCRNKQTISSLS